MFDSSRGFVAPTQLSDIRESPSRAADGVPVLAANLIGALGRVGLASTAAAGLLAVSVSALCFVAASGGVMTDSARPALQALCGIGVLIVALVFIYLIVRLSLRHALEQGRARQANQLLYETIEALPAGVLLFDAGERLVMHNSAALRSSPALRSGNTRGITYEEIVRRAFDRAAEFCAPFWGSPQEWLDRFRSRGAKTTRQAVGSNWFEWSERVTASGHIVALRTDITSLIRREQELARSRDEMQETLDKRAALEQRLESEMERLRSIVESSGALIVLADRDLNIVMANNEFWRSTGLHPERATGTSALAAVHSRVDRSAFAGWLAGPLTPEQAAPLRHTNRRRDASGRERIFNVTATPILDGGGNLRQILFLSVDDTERRETQQALVETERLAMVGEMAATVAHEIAQPLQIINLAGASARMEIEDAREAGAQLPTDYVVSKLERIDQQVFRANRIIDELRAYVRGTAYDVAARFDPAVAVRGAIDLTQHGLFKAGITLGNGVGEGLPAVVGHLSRLEQVLVNLINNARESGARTIELSAAELIQEGQRVLAIAIDDNGPGIPPALLPKLFQFFITTKPRGKGTGLGLRICRRIIEEMEGTISAANRTEGGARFEIRLPVAG